MNIIIFAFLIGIATANFPSNFKKCNRKDANFKTCVEEAASDGIKQLVKPFPKLNIPNVDPLEITQLNIPPGTEGVVAVEQKFKNCKAFGISKAKISDFEMKFDKRELILDATIPDIKLKCDYELDGKVLVLSIKGKGHSTIDLENVKLSLHTFWEETKRADGQTAVKFVKETTTLDPEKLEFNFENLFDGDKKLGDQVNKALNDNWKAVWDDAKSEYEKAIATIIVKIVNDFFSTISFEDAMD